MRLRILHFNDVHGRFEELARIASAIEELRDNNTLVFDGGDNADFARMEVEGTNGVISSAILNRIGVDARVFGNNEGFAGKPNGRIIAEHSDCPVVTCNMYDMKGRRLSFVHDAVILERSGVRIMVVGATAPYNVFYNLFRIDVKSPEEEIGRVFAEYDGFQYDLLVLLSHLGLERDREIARRFPDIDIIVSGHSHAELKEPVKQHKTIICHAGRFGEYLGELEVDFDKDRNRIQNFQARLLPARNYQPHSDIMKLIKHYSAVANRNLSERLYRVDVSMGHSLTRENALGNLLADSLKDLLKTEIGIVNSGVLHGGIRKGAVTKRLLHKICPSPLNPTYMEIKGVDLNSALEKSLSREYQLRDGGGPGSRARYLGNIQVSHNVQVSLCQCAKSPERIRSVTVDGEPLAPDRWYTVGTSDFLQRGTGYSELANNRNERYRPEFLRDVLRVYLRREHFRRRAFGKRFKVDKN